MQFISVILQKSFLYAHLVLNFFFIINNNKKLGCFIFLWKLFFFFGNNVFTVLKSLRSLLISLLPSLYKSFYFWKKCKITFGVNFIWIVQYKNSKFKNKMLKKNNNQWH